MNKFYSQLFSVKSSMKKDFKDTLKSLSDMGFDGVEFFGGYFGSMPADELRDYLEYVGMTPISAHVDLEELRNNIEFYFDFLNTLDCHYIVCPYAVFEDTDSAVKFGEELESIAEKCAQAGFNFAYHNHAHEFKKAENGEYLYDIMMEQAPLVLAELDVFWLEHAGVSIDETIRKYAGRINLIHLKQLDIVDGEKKISTLDKGQINFENVIKTAKMLGTEHFIIEQDMPVDDELTDAKTSIDFIKKVKA